MKLIVCIANRKYTGAIVKHLSQCDYRVTKLASTGFFNKGNDTLLVGVADEHLSKARKEMKEAVITHEKNKGWDPLSNRFTYFVVDTSNSLPFLKQMS